MDPPTAQLPNSTYKSPYTSLHDDLDSPADTPQPQSQVSGDLDENNADDSTPSAQAQQDKTGSSNAVQNLIIRAQVLTLLSTTPPTPVSTIKRTLSLSRSTIYRILRTAQSRGWDSTKDFRILPKHIEDAPRPGRPKIVTEEMEKNIEKDMEGCEEGLEGARLMPAGALGGSGGGINTAAEGKGADVSLRTLAERYGVSRASVRRVVRDVRGRKQKEEKEKGVKKPGKKTPTSKKRKASDAGLSMGTPLGTPMGTPSIQNMAPSVQLSSSFPPPPMSTNGQAMSIQAMNGQTLNSQTLNNQSLNSQSLNSQSMNSPMSSQAMGGQSHPHLSPHLPPHHAPTHLPPPQHHAPHHQQQGPPPMQAPPPHHHGHNPMHQHQHPQYTQHQSHHGPHHMSQHAVSLPDQTIDFFGATDFGRYM